MNPRDDENHDFDAAIAALRGSRVPRSGEHVARQVLAAFDRGPGRRARHRRTIGTIAAAALVVVAISLGVKAPNPPDRLSILEARLTELEFKAADWTRATRWSESPPSTPAEGSLAERLAPDFEASGFDPGLLRLVTARRLETVDADGARDRYRDLVAEYGDSPAAAVASERLRHLAP